MNLGLKLKLKDTIPPCTLSFHYVDSQRANLDFYISQEIKEPNEGRHHGHYLNVSSIVLQINVAHQNCNSRNLGWRSRKLPARLALHDGFYKHCLQISCNRLLQNTECSSIEG